jgi:putative hemolysin
VLLGLTTLQVILGELVPKSIALQHPTQIALYTVLPIHWSLTLFSWFIAVLNGSGVAILKLLRVPYGGHRHIHSPEEIDMLIAESRDGGLLEPDEQQRLHEALQLATRPAHRLMVPRQDVEAISIDTPPELILDQVARSSYTRIPVYHGSIDRIIGMIHTKDVVSRYMETSQPPTLEEILRPIPTVPETLTADRLLILLRTQRSHQAVVSDEFGGVEGLITLEDVLTEMLGQVADEFKADEVRAERLPDGRVRLPGRMYLDDVVEWLGVAWQGESDTVAGHVVTVMGHLPDPGERVTIDGVLVEVEQVVHHAVTSVLATPKTVGDDVANG